MKKSEIQEGLFVAERREIKSHNADREITEGFKILSSEADWRCNKYDTRPVQGDGEKGVHVQRVIFEDGKWGNSNWDKKPQVVPLQSLVTFEDFRAKCREKKTQYDHKISEQSARRERGAVQRKRSEKLGYSISNYDGSVLFSSSRDYDKLLNELEELRAFKASHS